MALRDTLNKVKSEQEERQAEIERRPVIIAKWQAAMDNLLNQIEKGLSEYVKEGTIVIKSFGFRHQDESFEPVNMRRLEIRAGDKVVGVNPLGRICFGAIGLAEMRCGNRQVKFSRQGDEDANQDVWKVVLPIIPEVDQYGRRAMDLDGPQFEDVSAELIEQSLDYVLG